MRGSCEEGWKDIPGWEGFYQVSDLGRIRSVDRRIPKSVGDGCRLMRGKVLKPGIYKNPGYSRVNLSRPGRTQWFDIHFLVLLAFVGPRPEGMECRHLDGVRMNSGLSNLCWGTSKQNQGDRRGHGTGNQGSRNHFSKVGEKEVFTIRQMAGNASRGEIARKLGLSYGIVSDVVAGRTWRHVPCESA